MRRSKGFTLIELLVVIAIIAILAAILFPVFAQARARARAISCVSNLKQIGTATNMYVQDYDETFPCGWGEPNGSAMWRMTIQPYIQKYGSQTDFYSTQGTFGVFVCPDTPANPPNFGPTSYGYNAFGGFTQGWKECEPRPGGGFWWGFPGSKLATIFKPANLVAYADASTVGQSRARDPNFEDGSPGWTGCGGSTVTGPFRFNPDVWREEWSIDWDFGVPGDGHTPNAGEDWGSCRNGGRRPFPRHFKQFNAAFADGHVKAVNQSQLNTQIMTANDILHNNNN
jgi:prepilin-type N-terminal cleavage/methylation domain-containing protein/prepilin-type processing-associated H-X9-DG protein